MEEGRAVQGNKGRPLEGQVVPPLCELYRPFSRRDLTNGGSDSLQVNDVVHPRDRVHRAPYPKIVNRKLHH